MEKTRVLVVDDEKLIRWSLEQSLSRAGYEVRCASSGSEVLPLVEDFRPQMVLLDIKLPDASGLELLPAIRAAEGTPQVVMMTAHAFADSVVEALQRGAADYLSKPFEIEAMLATIDNLLSKDRGGVEECSTRHRKVNQFENEQMIGNSTRMIEVFKLIQIAAETDCKTVLILGESGTGKELVAKAVHHHSQRKTKPFIEVNCAAIPESLLENELFGHEKGAYTDAVKDQKGVFECADGGTVFLDEIGDMPLHMQAKILKVIENKRFRRVGGTRDQNIDVRIVAATNQNLLQMVEKGTFRKDLFFRLNLLTIQLPALRERKEDLPNLIQYFIQRLNVEYGLNVKQVAPEALQKLLGYDWPGNVRELRNIIERAMLLEKAETLEMTFLEKSPAPHQAHPTVSAKLPQPVGKESYRHLVTLPPGGICIEEVERELIRQALERFDGNQTKAAQTLGISRDTLRYRLKKMLGATGALPETGSEPEPCNMSGS